jgi:hypothetical protein
MNYTPCYLRRAVQVVGTVVVSLTLGADQGGITLRTSLREEYNPGLTGTRSPGVNTTILGMISPPFSIITLSP